jgi:predicted RNA binding protein YcfA (HicA-like mRNA interferase family)
MANDPSPTGYTYDEAASVLEHLGFELAPVGAGSHRKWRRKCADGRVAIVGLVAGRGHMKAYLVRHMMDVLREHALLPGE